MSKKGSGLKKIAFELIAPDKSAEPYKLLDQARNKWHPELHEAHIALAWRKGLKPDVDGRLILGKCVKASDLGRELAEWDFIILLNREIWMFGENLRDFTTER